MALTPGRSFQDTAPANLDPASIEGTGLVPVARQRR